MKAKTAKTAVATETVKAETLKFSKASKKAAKEQKVDEANKLAMIAIRGLVEAGSKAVTFKENKTGSVMWVQIHKVENGLDNAVISNIKKAAAVFGKGASCNSFTLAYSGYKCLHIKQG